MGEKERKQMENAQHADSDKIFNLPNMLSFFRLALIPVIVILYENESYWWAFGMLFLSGVTDVVDGWIARTFHLVTDFGKAIDPLADKLTQVALLLCLMQEYWWVVAVLMFKEIFIGILSFATFRKTNRIFSAGWYGKLCTVVIYLSLGILILWRDPSPTFVLIDSLVIVGLILLSFTKYFMYFTKILRYARSGDQREAT